MVKKVKYTGVLNKPIELIQFKPLGMMSFVQDREKYELAQIKMIDENFSEQLSERIIALFEHYKIDRESKDADMDLALALASDHIKGFSFKDKNKRAAHRPKELEKKTRYIATLKRWHPSTQKNL